MLVASKPHGLNAIRELYVPALEAVFDSDELIEVKRSFGRIIGRIQEILEVVVKVYPELDDLRDQT